MIAAADEVSLAYPVVTVNQDGSVVDAQGDGIRFVLARQGLFREVTSSWMTCRHQISMSTLTLPFGPASASLKLKCSLPPHDVWKDFVLEARADLPNEAAAQLVWNEVSDTWRCAMRGSSHASPGRIDYLNPVLDDDEVAVIDVHSHGEGRAFFSRTDDIDDRGSFKIAAVFGRVGTRPELLLRLVMGEAFWPITMTSDGQFQVEGFSE
jgi:PRTRC genetic system protein A